MALDMRVTGSHYERNNYKIRAFLFAPCFPSSDEFDVLLLVAVWANGSFCKSAGI